MSVRERGFLVTLSVAILVYVSLAAAVIAAVEVFWKPGVFGNILSYYWIALFAIIGYGAAVAVFSVASRVAVRPKIEVPVAAAARERLKE